MDPKPDFSFVYDGLKDFQKHSVDYIFNRLYKDPDRVNRFLLADEVGLGKTLVAKGVIAKSLDYLWDKIERLDIIYICSNTDIAKQNVNRLKITADNFSLASRITMLPAQLKELTSNKVNFVSLTPGTSFDLRSSTGKKEERILIYAILCEAWNIPVEDFGPIDLMQCTATEQIWRRDLKNYLQNSASKIDEELKQLYIDALAEKPELKERFFAICEHFRTSGGSKVPPYIRDKRNRLISDLRLTLAAACIHALKPDIIILDEFQRFKYLLDDQNPIRKLADHLFEYYDPKKPVDTKILLLSATPYKMYTMHHEVGVDDHHKDFLKTINFLYEPHNIEEEMKQLFERYRRYIYSLEQNQYEINNIKNQIEHRLRKVMARTERLGVTEDRNGMVQDNLVNCIIKSKDLLAYKNFDAVCQLLEVGDHIEFWKSSPFLLNLMDSYAVKKKLKKQLDDSEHYSKLTEAITGSSEGFLRWSSIANYRRIDPENPRLREIINNNVDKGWQLLWIPPALPYYKPAGKYASAEVSDFTKMLVFSSWKVVPKAISMLCSYEAEKRAVRKYDDSVTYSKIYDKITPLLQFTFSEGRYTGMPALALLYPCLTLANEIDPYKISMESSKLPSQKAMLEKVKNKIKELMSWAVDFSHYPNSGPEDEKWYWASLALLDKRFNYRYEKAIDEWFNRKDENAFYKVIEGREDEGGRFAEHVNEFIEFYNFPQKLGRPPRDLYEVLARIALASPAVTAYRSIKRKVAKTDSAFYLAAASKLAVGFRSTFNMPVAIALLREKQKQKPYWKKVLEYATDGNLQAVLDEYVHILYESLGLANEEDDYERAAFLRDEIYKALSLRTTRAEFDDLRFDKKNLSIKPTSKSIRCRYALRLQESKTEDGDVTREDQVRAAFNSPFRPFILATTSIGQEGLDFHQYCHAICHWNLPSNPVDLEQREGRIHRYKGHVIRKNIAKHYGLKNIRGSTVNDPWEALFDQAVADRKPHENDLVPYWLFESKNGYKIERHVPVLPLSKEIKRIEDLKRGLVLYRMVFGQPRQEDLLNFLQETVSDNELPDMFDYRIDLEPK